MLRRVWLGYVKVHTVRMEYSGNKLDILFVSIYRRRMCSCQYIVDLVFLAYVMVIVEVNFVAGIGLGVGIDFLFDMDLASLLDSETD